MPRPSRRALAAAATAISALAAPAAAGAATYSVDSSAAAGCGGADTSCKTITEAASAVAAGDTVQIVAGTYAESVTFDEPGLTIRGVPGVAVTGPAGATGATPTLTFSAAAGSAPPSTLTDVAVGATGAGAPAISVTGTDGLALDRGLVASGKGPAVRFTESTRNAIAHTAVFTLAPGSNAVDVVSGAASPAAKALTLDSTLLVGGANAAGLAATSPAGVPTSMAGDVSITARHVTIARSAKGIVLDASTANGAPAVPIPLLGPPADPAANMTATVSDSIVLGVSSAAPNPGGPTSAPNTATLSFVRTSRDADPATTFVDPARGNFHLRPGAAVIDQGAAEGAGETDIDGQPRLVGPASDLGADEFVAGPAPAPVGPGAPTTAVPGPQRTPPAVSITTPKSGQRVPLSKVRTRTVTRHGKKVRIRTRRAVSVRFAGRASDPQGVDKVVLALRQLSRANKASGAAARCRWVDPRRKRTFTRSCTNPILFNAKLKDGRWTANLPKGIKISRGSYRLFALGRDKAGAVGNSLGAITVRFRLT